MVRGASVITICKINYTKKKKRCETDAMIRTRRPSYYRCDGSGWVVEVTEGDNWQGIPAPFFPRHSSFQKVVASERQSSDDSSPQNDLSRCLALYNIVITTTV